MRRNKIVIWLINVLIQWCAAAPAPTDCGALSQPSQSATSPPMKYDACGPTIQSPGETDTCNTPVTFGTFPAPYKVFLSNDGSGDDITYENCLPIVLDVCATLTNPQTPVGQWNWTGQGSGCTMGFWLPQYSGSAPVPSLQACKENIYTPLWHIAQSNGGTAQNQATINLATLPNNDQTGAAVNVGYPSYTLTYLPLIQGPSVSLVVCLFAYLTLTSDILISCDSENLALSALEALKCLPLRPPHFATMLMWHYRALDATPDDARQDLLDFPLERATAIV